MLKPTYTYFLAANVQGVDYIKIGSTNHPGGRMTTHRVWARERFGHTDVAYLAVVPEDSSPETATHMRFWHLNSIPPVIPEYPKGHEPSEWFRSCPELLAYIESLRSSFVPVRWTNRTTPFWRADPRW